MTMHRAADTSRASGTQTLERGLDLLQLVARDPMRMSDVVKRSGLSRSTTSRLLHCLVERSLLMLGADGQLRPGPALLLLGAAAQKGTELLTIAVSHLTALSERTGLSSFLGSRDGDYSVHLHRTPGTGRMIVATAVGTRRRLAETSLGKALLLDDDPASWRRLLADAAPVYQTDHWEADMRASVERGFVLHESPPPDSIHAIAAPVRDARGQIVAAISVASVEQYLDSDGMLELAPVVRNVAHDISAELGWPRPVP